MGYTLPSALLHFRITNYEWLRLVASGFSPAPFHPRSPAPLRSPRALDAPALPEELEHVAFVRLVPVFTYNVMNYLLGLTHIPFHHYILSTIVFMARRQCTWLSTEGPGCATSMLSSVQ